MIIGFKTAKKYVKDGIRVNFTTKTQEISYFLEDEDLYNAVKETVVNRLKKLYPAMKKRDIIKQLNDKNILPNHERLGEYGKIIGTNKELAPSFYVHNNELHASSYYSTDDDVYNCKLDMWSGTKLPERIAVVDPFTGRFAMFKEDKSLYQLDNKKLFHVHDDDLPLELKFALTENDTFNLEVDEQIFKGMKAQLTKLDKQKTDYYEMNLEYKKLAKKLDKLNNNEIKPLKQEINQKAVENLVKFDKSLSKNDFHDYFMKNEEKIQKFFARQCSFNYDGETINISGYKHHPCEGDFHDALYNDGYNDLCVDSELEDEYINKFYKKEVKLFEKEIKKINKKLGTTNPIQLKTNACIFLGDKTANVYVSANYVYDLPKQIDKKYFNKFMKFVESI